MSRFDDKARDWQARVERFRRLSTLIGEDGASAPLRAIALEIEQNHDRWRQVMVMHRDLQRWRTTLIAEIDALLARSRGSIFFSKHLLRPFRFDAQDIREESRQCRDEARTTADTKLRRGLAARALALAFLAEEVERARHL